MQQMFTSATDITSNPGNAALGYSGGVNYALNPADANPGAVTQSVIGAIAQTEERKRIAERARQQEEQDKLAAYLAGTGESVFNMKGPDGKPGGFDMLPSDREYINEQTNEIRNKIISEPDKYKFDAGLQSKIQEFNQVKNLAGIRATEVAKRKVLASQTNDMRERERILQSIDEIEKEPIYSFKTPKPYLPSATWDIEGLGVDKDVLSGKKKEGWDMITVGTEMVDGNEVEIKRPGIRASVLDTRNRMTKGSKEFINAENMVKAFYADPSLVTKKNIVQLNDAIAKFNADRGLQPGDANFAPPVGTVYGDGSVELPPLNDKTIADIAYGLLAQKAGQLGVDKEIKKTKSELDKEKSAMKVAEGNLAVNQGQLKLNRDIFEANKNKLSKEEQEKGDAELLAQGDAVRIYEILKEGENGAPAEEVFAAIPESQKSGLYKTLQERGLDIKDYLVSTLPTSDRTIKNIAGIAGLNEKGTPTGVIKKPIFGYTAVPKDGDMRNAIFVFQHATTKPVIEDGEVVMDAKTKKPKMQEVLEWRTMNGQEAIDSYVQSSNSFKPKTDKVTQKVSRSQEYLDKIFAQEGSSKSKPQATPPKEYIRTGKEIVGPELSSINEEDMKEENGVRMYRYNGKWRKVVSLDDKKRLLLE